MTSHLAWQRTVGQLDAGCAQQLTARVRRIVDSQRPGSLPVRVGGIAVALLDRPSPRTVTVSWSDPRGCKYGEQVWRTATAKRSGVCALSGQSIVRGAPIYRPTKVEPPPANADAMILATVVDTAFADPLVAGTDS
ncbi:DUF3331 domain-containing protein [Paraburkholderia sp. BCC1886]|uniref:DUF3331 domain-containing protein n=1 Tax=Paraburkholderia sp. BCC1886 TaxID=2562670 RepID=UPI001182EA5E|nr:DUF3331 domain-containing protein [Paraburkholderia sp. BCC1886]